MKYIHILYIHMNCILYIVHCVQYTSKQYITVYILRNIWTVGGYENGCTHCTMYIVQCTLCNVHCILTTIKRTLYMLYDQCTLYSVIQCTSYSGRCMCLCTCIHYLYTVHWPLYTIHWPLYSVH